jgi:hypothetical protein
LTSDTYTIKHNIYKSNIKYIYNNYLIKILNQGGTNSFKEIVNLRSKSPLFRCYLESASHISGGDSKKNMVKKIKKVKKYNK